jgi:transcriptional regulator with XRE-family HTH domain
MAIDIDIRQRAEELFIIDGLTLQEVAGQTGISERTLANWSTDGEWVSRRREYQNAARDIKYYGKMTRLKLIKDAMTSLDPQKIYAFATLERTMAEGQKSEDRSQESGVIGDITIKTPQEAVAALQGAVEKKLAVMLARPDALNLGAIKELKQVMELVEGMKIKYSGKEDKSDRLLSSDEIKAIREQVI